MTQTARQIEAGREIRFDYAEYAQILDALAPRIVDFEAAMGSDRFVVLRHDVEFDLDRAVEMARIDAAKGVASSFFVQVASDAYNPAGPAGRAALAEIRRLGHRVGLHLHRMGLGPEDRAAYEAEIAAQAAMLAQALGAPVMRMSYHRPAPWQLEERADHVCGLLNAYGPSFFEFSDAPSRIVYSSDSQREWRYGHPLDLVDRPRVQLLMHPDEWTAAPVTMAGNFAALTREADERLQRTFKAECKHYDKRHR